MVEAAGLRVVRTTTTGVPLDEVWKKARGEPDVQGREPCQHAARPSPPRLFGFQWIMVCKAADAAG
jgi:hypothetical protein